jgi:peptidyl-Lys metalloendopeptidase
MRIAIHRLFLVGLVAATQACADPPQDAQDLQIDLAVNGSAIADVTITNNGSASVELLAWELPSADLQEPLFAVTRGGQATRYIGPHYKRAQPDASDLVTLAPGDRLVRQVDLARFYDFSQTADYDVEVVIGTVHSPSVTTHVEGRVASREKPVRESCTASQKAEIAEAANVGRQYANAANTYLGGSPSATQRYTTWFGAFSTSGWNQVHNNFTAISSAFNNQTITPDCKCRQKNVYAYVYPDQPYTIYLCGAFWAAPTSGTDSRAGTLVHEMSHFNVTAGTDDNAYGKSACMSLAESDPAAARNNADSHEYFAENTPALP